MRISLSHATHFDMLLNASICIHLSHSAVQEPQPVIESAQQGEPKKCASKVTTNTKATKQGQSKQNGAR
jgi:hypothetical protein